MDALTCANASHRKTTPIPAFPLKGPIGTPWAVNEQRETKVSLAALGLADYAKEGNQGFPP
jgi:hypothetical protein